MSQTFSNADQYDFFLMFLGTIGALTVGCSTPVTNVIFGQMINALNKNPNSFSERVDTLCIAYVIVGVVNMLAGYLQVYCWTATGERQTQRFRERYVNALLSQEIGWFDTIGAGQLNTKVAEVIGEIQDGLSRKIGDLLQNGIQVIGSLVVAFYLCWELTLVLLACIPCLAVAATYMIKVSPLLLLALLARHQITGYIDMSFLEFRLYLRLLIKHLSSMLELGLLLKKPSDLSAQSMHSTCSLLLLPSIEPSFWKPCE